MKFWLCAIAFISAGSAVPWFIYTPSDEDFSVLLDSRGQLLDEIAKLEQALTLPAVSASWYQLKRYVSWYEDLSLQPAAADALAEKIETNAWHGVLIGDLEQLFAIVVNLQTLIPVHFSYFSVDEENGRTTGALTLSMLGTED